MRKSVIWIAVIVAVLFFTGCTKDKEDANASSIGTITKSSAVEAETEPESKIDPEIKTDTNAESDAEAFKVKTEDIMMENTIVDDSIGMYAVSKEWAKNYGIYAMKNGGLYSISSTVPVSVIEAYDVGWRKGQGVEEAELYLFDSDSVTKLSTGAPIASIAVGDFPVLKVSKSSDKVIAFGTIQVLDLTETYFYGYTIDVHDRDYGNLEFMPLIDHTLISVSGEIAQQAKHDFGIFDINDNPVEDFRNLNYGEEYAFRWYAGSECYEIKEKAVCKCYPISSEAKRYTLKGTLTKNGYVEFDISEIPSGLYGTLGGGIFEVVD